jgi:hypothetical protein
VTDDAAAASAFPAPHIDTASNKLIINNNVTTCPRRPAAIDLAMVISLLVSFFLFSKSKLKFSDHRKTVILIAANQQQNKTKQIYNSQTPPRTN